MATKKYIKQLSGQLTEQQATVVSTGAPEEGNIVALDATGRLDQSVLPIGIIPETATAISSEIIAAGAFVNFYNNAGVLTVRNADATGGNTKKAHGYVLSAVAVSGTATVYIGNLNNQLAGLTIGATYYLSNIAVGAVVFTAPSGAGQIVQQLGVAISATSMLVEIQTTITIA